MVKAKKNIRANAMMEMKRLYKMSDFNTWMLKGLLADGRKVKK